MLGVSTYEVSEPPSPDDPQPQEELRVVRVDAPPLSNLKAFDEQRFVLVFNRPLTWWEQQAAPANGIEPDLLSATGTMQLMIEDPQLVANLLYAVATTYDAALARRSSKEQKAETFRTVAQTINNSIQG